MLEDFKREKRLAEIERSTRNRGGLTSDQERELAESRKRVDWQGWANPAEASKIIILMVIGQAMEDLAEGLPAIKKDAQEFFDGPVYLRYLDFLDLPLDWKPESN